METIRTFILSIGWPILIVGSIVLAVKSLQFYRNVGKTIWGKLVIAMVAGWFISMYSLGIVATAYMFAEAETGVLVVLPIFLVWLGTMIAITWSVLRWSKAAETLSAFYRGLEDAVKGRTEELERAQKIELQHEREIRKLRERFVFIAAHELRTPVTAMDWGLDILINDAELQKALPEDYQKLLADLKKKNKALFDLVEDLLSIARLQTKTRELEITNVSIEEVLKSAAEELTPSAKAMDVRISWPEENIRNLRSLRTDISSLKQVLSNLICNAIQYNKRGGWVSVDGEIRSNEVIMSIKDGGIGISEAEMKNLFREFYRAKNPETRHIEGTGLGLFIAKQLVEQMGGRIWAESVKGQGSTFFFSVPLNR